MIIKVNGGKALKGEVKIPGGKNSFLPLIAASCVTTDDIVFNNIPLGDDNTEKLEMIKSMGTKIDYYSCKEIKINSKDFVPISNKISRFRTTILLLGVSLARFGVCKISYPKGDQIGARKIDFHIDALEKMGATFEFSDNYIEGKAEKMIGIEYTLKFASVGATQNIIIAASLAHGITILNNAGIEPEIIYLCYFLNSIGCNIEGIGQSRLVIHGSNGKLYNSNKTHYCNIISDRLQAATYLIAGAITNGDVTILGEQFLFTLSSLLEYLTEMGFDLICSNNSIRCVRSAKLYIPKEFNILTNTFPGFATDLQPLIVPLLCCRSSKSTIKEFIFENRFEYINELKKMGANIKEIGNNSIEIQNISQFNPSTNLLAKDIRGGASVLLSTLNAEGESHIFNFYQITRGYDNLIKNLFNLGADIGIKNKEDYNRAQYRFNFLN